MTRSRITRALLVGAPVAAFLFLFQAPVASPAEPLVTIPEGASFGEIAGILDRGGVITSTAAFRAATALVGGARNLKAGAYLFERPEPLIKVARRVATGAFGVDPNRIVFPEGMTTKEMGEALAAHLAPEEAARFVRDASPREGFLFPDTYFFLPTATSGEVIAKLEATFQEKTAELQRRAAESGRAWRDIVIMASILEEEANTPDDRRMVADILWRRLDEGMPLQVDASFAYLLGKASSEVTQEDLELDSPYNTYEYKGLPPTPISNPGLEALEDALDPISNEYWFYLSDAEGAMHYAVTYDEHLDNKARYID